MSGRKEGRKYMEAKKTKNSKETWVYKEIQAQLFDLRINRAGE